MKIIAALLALAAGLAAVAQDIEFPLDRTAYFVGESIPLAVTGRGKQQVELAGRHGKSRVFSGPPGVYRLDSSKLAAGDYRVLVNGRDRGRLTLTSPQRKSAASLQDEILPSLTPRLNRKERKDPKVRAAKIKAHQDRILAALRESELTSCFSMAAVEMSRDPVLDLLARTGTMVFVNPHTRPTSFHPVGLDPNEIDQMSQRMILTAQANGRYPNFGGFCFGWDTTGYKDFSRNGLLIYWGWKDQSENLRWYAGRQQQIKEQAFRQATGMKPVTQKEYIQYLLGINKPELAPYIDLPTREWLREIAGHIKPLPTARRAAFEKRLDAWSQFHMGIYNHAYSGYIKNLRGAVPAMRHSSSVQIDHCPTLYGQYFPSAYRSLDFQYQSTWNDQVGGPDYSYQWLLTQALLHMSSRGRPTWISNAFSTVHGRAAFPGKFVKVSAHGLAYGCSGNGFALEGFSNILGGMNRGSAWQNIRTGAGGADVRAGKEFLDRFACLAREGRGDFGVGVLFSKSQLGRQYISMGFAKPQYLALVALARLGYTPRYITEEQIVAGELPQVKALVVVTQPTPLPPAVLKQIDTFAKAGGKVVVDGNTTATVPGAVRLQHKIPFRINGKPHNMGSPNLPKGVNDTLLYARLHKELAPAFSKALGDTGRGILRAAKGAATQTTLLQIDGGEATYIVAVNDSHVKNHCDWVQLKEEIRPAPGAKGVLYDCSEEKEIGPLKPIRCDLSRTTARVFAVLPEPLKNTRLKATQQLRSGDELRVAVSCHTADRPLKAVIPFHLTLRTPAGKAFAEFYRSTDAAGRFAMAVPVPVNVPAGTWTLQLRCQLNGRTATLPIRIRATERSIATPWNDTVVVRERDAAEAMLSRGKSVVIPLFPGPQAEKLAALAQRAKTILQRRGVKVEIRKVPQTTYWLAYKPTTAQAKDNQRVDRGDAIGKIKRVTVNRNDWYSGMSGYRFPKPVLLLDATGAKGDSPLAESLDGKGLLWPQVTAAFPANGGAVIQTVHWAFAPHASAMVIQAHDAAGLRRGVDALGKLPADSLTASVRQVRGRLFRQQYVGGTPAVPAVTGLTDKGLQAGSNPQPFRLSFPGAKPPVSATPPAPYQHPRFELPTALRPKAYIPMDVQNGAYIETSTAGALLRDLRFSKAIKVLVSVKRAGKIRITGEGTFRYSDRTPRSQAQWESILEIYNQAVPKQRRPMAIEVRVNGKAVGKLVPVRTEKRDMPIETLPWYVKQKPKSVHEEVVTQLAGDIQLPAGSHELLFIHHNIVDGYLNALHLGITPTAGNKLITRKNAADKAAKKRRKKH